MKSNKTLKLGIVGTGNIGQVHIRNFQNLHNVEIFAVADTVEASAQSAAQTYNIPNVYQDYQQLLANEEIDAIVIGVPNFLHAEIAVAALQNGKHVLIEKPMGINAEQAKQIAAAARATDRIVMVAHQMRWIWANMQVQDQIAKGALGQIYHAKTGWFRRKGIPGWGTWFTQKDLSGGGPLIDIGVHMLDLALFLMGNPKPVSVYGSTYAEFGPKKKGIGTWGKPNWDGTYDVEDLATALIKMEDGSSLSLEVSWAVHMDTSNAPFVHLMGSEGGASLYDNHGKFLIETLDRHADLELKQPNNVDDPRLLMARHFVSCVENNTQPISDVMSGLTNNLILEAIYESSRTGKEVILDYNF